MIGLLFLLLMPLADREKQRQAEIQRIARPNTPSLSKVIWGDSRIFVKSTPDSDGKCQENEPVAPGVHFLLFQKT
jgi:hypothetical protein